MPGLPTNTQVDPVTKKKIEQINQQFNSPEQSRLTFAERQALMQYNINYAARNANQIAAIYAAQGGSKSAAPSPVSTSGVPQTTNPALATAQSMATADGMSNSTVIQNALTKQAAQYYGGNDDPNVYIGGGVYSAGVGTPNTMKLSQLANQWYTMDQADKDKFMAQLAKAGYKTETMSDANMADLWASYAGQAAAYNANGKQMTLWDVLALDAQHRKTAAPVTTTNTSTSTQISNYQDTHALFQSAAQSLLGRAPTVAETKAFQKQLNAYQAANPTKTTTTQTTDAMGNSTSTSTSSGGTTAAGLSDLAQQQAQQNPDYGAYQAATTYFNALLGAIGHM